MQFQNSRKAIAWSLKDCHSCAEQALFQAAVSLKVGDWGLGQPRCPRQVIQAHRTSLPKVFPSLRPVHGSACSNNLSFSCPYSRVKSAQFAMETPAIIQLILRSSSQDSPLSMSLFQHLRCIPLSYIRKYKLLSLEVESVNSFQLKRRIRQEERDMTRSTKSDAANQQLLAYCPRRIGSWISICTR